MHRAQQLVIVLDLVFGRAARRADPDSARNPRCTAREGQSCNETELAPLEATLRFAEHCCNKSLCRGAGGSNTELTRGATSQGRVQTLLQRNAMTTARHRHRGASYVASASDGIIKTSHKVYASSSDDDSPAGFLQSAYNSPPASPRCAPRRQVTYSVTESEEDVSESPDAFVVELTRSDNFWTQRVRWYPDNCFGPYRAERLGYSRRELCADALVHLVGIVAFSAGAGALLHACCVHEPSVETTVSLLLYVCSLLTMLGCSFLCGNQTPGAPRHRRDVVPVTASARWRGGS